MQEADEREERVRRVVKAVVGCDLTRVKIIPLRIVVNHACYVNCTHIKLKREGRKELRREKLEVTYW